MDHKSHSVRLQSVSKSCYDILIAEYSNEDNHLRNFIMRVYIVSGESLYVNLG